MAELIVSDEQARMLSKTGGVVVLKDQQGNVVGGAYRTGRVDLKKVFTPEQIAEAKRRSQSKGPWLTTSQVLEHLRTLGE